MSDILIPSPSAWNKADAHAMADDCGEWACSHMPRLVEADLDRRMAEKRAFIPQGCDQQGRLQPTIPAEAVTEYGMDYEDQSRSADRDAFRFFAKFYGSILVGVLALHFVLQVLKGVQA